MTSPRVMHASGNQWNKIRDWAWRVRRDILALEYVSVNQNDWGALRTLFKNNKISTRHPLLRSNERLATTMKKVEVLLAALRYPPDPQPRIGGDPGAPPLPPE